MPPQIVVVKRPRGGLFAGVLSLPHWLRAIWRDDGEWRARLRARANDDVSSGANALERGASLTPIPRRPRLRTSGREAVECGRCAACIAACPSHALAREGAAVGDPSGVLRLDLGRCIGCGLCVDACPEAALELIDAPPALWAPTSDQPLSLALSERRHG